MQMFTDYYSNPAQDSCSSPSSTETLPDSPSDTRKSHFSGDQEVILASNTPKKRAGRKKFRETRHPVYRGVRQRSSSKWVCELRLPNKKTRIWLGTFPTVVMAARAHDVAALAFRGRSACLNFADSAWRLPVPASTDPNDIRKAAVEAAEAFRHQSPDESGDRATTAVGSPENLWLVDDGVYEVHRLLADMAEGLMMLPPPQYSDDVGLDDDVSLWNYLV